MVGKMAVERGGTRKYRFFGEMTSTCGRVAAARMPATVLMTTTSHRTIRTTPGQAAYRTQAVAGDHLVA